MTATAHDHRPAGPATPDVSVLTLAEMTVTRLHSNRDDLPPMPASTPVDAFNVICQLADFRLHRLWRGNTLVFEGGHPRGAIAITDLRDSWRCHHLSPFDNMRFLIPFATLADFAEGAGRLDYAGLSCRPGTRDDIMLGLSQALLPVMDRPDGASRLFLSQLSLAILTHLAQAYGGMHFPSPRKGLLAPWQQKRVTEMLASRMADPGSIAELAAACDLSRSYFIKAFRATFGKTPHRWLMDYRVARVRELLLTDQPIADIALACGFSDQSHLTRVFAAFTGEAPGSWRRRHRSD